jgi:hypothetical protein
MVTNSFGNRNFMEPMRRLNMHSKYLDFIFLQNFGWGAGGQAVGGLFFFIFFSFVPCKFSMGSHHVPNVFLKWMFPIAPRFNSLKAWRV